MKRTITVSLIFGSILFPAVAAATVKTDPLAAIHKEELQQYLKDFYSNSVEAMNRVPVKRDEQGNIAPEEESIFDEESVRDGSFIRAKDETRTRIMQAAQTFRPSILVKAPPGEKDQVDNLLEIPNIYRTLKDMELAELLSAELEKKPWSDSYWPMNKGLGSSRYADPGFPRSKSPAENFAYILRVPPSSMIAAGRGGNLAPNEKYDYILGDDSYTLSRRAWDVVTAAARVPGWAGICDGWSGASISNDEPTKAITVVGANGRSMRFYPHDIKGLGAMLWSKGSFQTRFIGGRCTISKPDRDAVGRTISPECADNNPASWHVGVVNRIGQEKKALIIDGTYDHQVWNFPVWKYRYSYFHPQTLRPVSRWRDALVPIDRFKIDKFKSYRSPEAKYVVGISMYITYTIENRASHSEGSRVHSKSVHYIYDLELDGDMKIIGGEWYSNIHPDFIWYPKSGSRAASVGDHELGDPSAWTGSEPMPEHWFRAARIASMRLQPLAAVVERLFQLSSQAPEIESTGE